MDVSIDRLGRVVIPKGVRDELGLKPGSTAKLEVVDGHVEIEPRATRVRLERRGHLTVAVPLEVAVGRRITTTDVQRLINEDRDQRGRIGEDHR